MANDLLPCPFCGSKIRHVDSWAKSFNPARLYHEWHHDETFCQIHPQGRGTMVADATDDPEMQARAIERWNTRSGTTPGVRADVIEVENFDDLEGLVSRFSSVLFAKLRAAANKGRSGWDATDWKADCQRGLARHVAKGDPLDVAAYAAFCWHHGWPTVGPITPQEYEQVRALANQDAPTREGDKS